MRLLPIILILAVLLYGTVVAGLFLFQRRLLYLPEAHLPDPEQLGLRGIEVMRPIADDGTPLLAWYAKPSHDDGYIVLYLHGNAGHIGDREDQMRRMRRLGWGVFMLEYRGYGGNPGKPTEDGLRRDARAGLAALRALGFPPGRILLWGESLGTGLAIGLATEQPADEPDVAAVLLESPYTSIADTAQFHYPYVPARWLIHDKFDSLSRISRVRAPIFIMQGTLDRIVPPMMGRALLAAATAPAEIWSVPGAGHNDLTDAGAIEAAGDFVSRLPSMAVQGLHPRE